MPRKRTLHRVIASDQTGIILQHDPRKKRDRCPKAASQKPNRMFGSSGCALGFFDLISAAIFAFIPFHLAHAVSLADLMFWFAFWTACSAAACACAMRATTFADVKPPAAPFEHVVERGHLAAGFAHLDAEPDHLVVHKDRRFPAIRGGRFPAIPLNHRSIPGWSRADSKRLSAEFRRGGGILAHSRTNR